MELAMPEIRETAQIGVDELRSLYCVPLFRPWSHFHLFCLPRDGATSGASERPESVSVLSDRKWQVQLLPSCSSIPISLSVLAPANPNRHLLE